MGSGRFGVLRDGTVVDQVRLTGGDLSVSVISLGAAVQDLRLAGALGGRSLVLGYQQPQDYLDYCHCFGAVVGRVANRIAGGRFPLDGRTVQLSVNEFGRNHLHGGVVGFHARNWTFTEIGIAFVELTLTAEAGEEGYPGKLEVRCRYEIEGRTLRVSLTATTDAPTVINLAPHSYFNLEGGGDVLGHQLRIAAQAYTPLGPHNIPTGEIASLEGGRFDFRQARAIGWGPAETHPGNDVNLVLDPPSGAAPRFAARLSAPVSGLAVELWTTQPGLQIYDAGFLIDPAPGVDDAAYPRFGGLALEAQNFPDAPNHANFPSATLRPGEVYRSVTEYRFD